MLAAAAFVGAVSTGLQSAAQEETATDPRLDRAATWAVSHVGDSAWGVGLRPFCQTFVEDAFGAAGSFGDPSAMIGALGVSLREPRIGEIVAIGGDDLVPPVLAGLYVGEGQIVATVESGVRRLRLENLAERGLASYGVVPIPGEWPGVTPGVGASPRAGGDWGTCELPLEGTGTVWRNILENASAEPRADAPAMPAPDNWLLNNPIAGAITGPVWDATLAHSGRRSFALRGAIGAAPRCWPIVERGRLTAGTCAAWVSDWELLEPAQPYEIGYWKAKASTLDVLASIQLRVMGGGIGLLEPTFRITAEDDAWQRHTAIVPPNALSAFGAPVSASFTLRAAVEAPADRMAWIDDVSFGPPESYSR